MSVASLSTALKLYRRTGIVVILADCRDVVDCRSGVRYRVIIDTRSPADYRRLAIVLSAEVVSPFCAVSLLTISPADLLKTPLKQ